MIDELPETSPDPEREDFLDYLQFAVEAIQMKRANLSMAAQFSISSVLLTHAEGLGQSYNLRLEQLIFVVCQYVVSQLQTIGFADLPV